MREIYSLIEEYKENNDCTIVTGINGDISMVSCTLPGLCAWWTAVVVIFVMGM